MKYRPPSTPDPTPEEIPQGVRSRSKVMAAKKKQNTLPPISEAEFQKQVIDLAKLRGWKVAHFRPARVIIKGKETWRTPVQGDAGFPDLVLAQDRVVIHAELKSDTGIVSAEQQAWLIALGGVVWRPKHWPEIERLLR